jgi:hypothetical protein
LATTSASASATKSAIAGEHSFDAFASLATGTINVFATTVTGEHSFDAFTSLAAGAFEVFTTGAGVPLTVPAFLPPLWAKQQLPWDSLWSPGQMHCARHHLQQARKGLLCALGGE